MKRLIATFILMSLMSIIAALMAPQQASASTYRYWTYWWGRPGQTSWQYAQLGPGGDVPGDGWVLGWRYETTNASGAGAQPPRAPSQYKDLCQLSSAGPAGERVAVVVDYGDPADSPDGQTTPGPTRVECTEVPTQSHGSAVMRAAGVSLRVENGFVCGIDGYPMLGCSTPVAVSPTPTNSPKPATSASPTPTKTHSPSPSAVANNAATKPPSAIATPTVTATPSPSTSVVVIPSTGGSSKPATTPTESAGAPIAANPTSTSQSPAPNVPAVASQAATVTDSRSAFGLIIGLVGVAILAGSAWFTSRRRGGA